MAITTIPWGDGSGDNIYLSAPSQTGDQSVSVTSDPNTGAARSKVVTFSASGVSPVTLTINQDAGSTPLPAMDGKIWVYYDVITNTDTTKILYSASPSNLTNTMLVDGVSESITNWYQFPTTGEHLVQFTLASGATSIIASQFRNIPRARKIFIPDSIISLANYCLYQTSWDYVVFRSTTPATLGALPMYGSFKIYVPYSSDHSVLQSYKTAWSSYQGRIYELNADGSVPE